MQKLKHSHLQITILYIPLLHTLRFSPSGISIYQTKQFIFLTNQFAGQVSFLLTLMQHCIEVIAHII